MEELIRLQLRGPASSKPVPMLVDPSRKISSQMGIFLRKLGLTPEPEDPAYDLHHAESKSILNPELSFRAAGVKENHVLVLLPRVVAPHVAPIDDSHDFTYSLEDLQDRMPEKAPVPPAPPPEAIVAFENMVDAIRRGHRSRIELEPLLEPAIAVAGTSKQKIKIFDVIRRHELRSGIPWVAFLLRDGDSKVRQQAVRVLTRMMAEDQLEELRPLLKDPVGKVRGDAAMIVARFDGEASAPALLPMLDDADPDARAGAAQALRQIPVKGREGLYLRLLEDADESVRATAVDALADLYPEAMQVRLEALLADPSDEIRRAACGAAGLMKAKAAIPSLLRILEKDSEAGDVAMKTLVELGAREASDLIRSRLSAKSPWDQRGALEALCKLGTVEKRDVVPFVVHADVSLRCAAIPALHKLKARTELAKLLADGNPEVQIQACEAVGGPEEIRRLREFLTHRLPDVRRAALHGLAFQQIRVAAPEITPLLLDPDPYVRAQALQSLERLEYLPAARSIAPMIGDYQAFVRVSAASALRQLGTPDVCSDLLPHLSHPFSRVRLLALRLLHDFDARSALSAISPLLKDPNAAVRANAAARLAHLGAESALPAIRELLADPSANVRWFAAAAIASFGDRTPVKAALDPGREAVSIEFGLLNGAREPILWKQLRDAHVASDLSGAPAALMSGIAEQAGVLVDMNPEFRALPAPDPDQVYPIRARSRMTLLTALILATEDHDFLLDAGRIRIVPRRAAVAEWMTWIG